MYVEYVLHVFKWFTEKDLLHAERHIIKKTKRDSYTISLINQQAAATATHSSIVPLIRSLFIRNFYF